MEKFTKYNNGSSDLNDEEFGYIHTDLILVGVLTAREYINTRMEAINGTWAETIPGKVLFFSGEDSTSNSTESTTK